MKMTRYMHRLCVITLAASPASEKMWEKSKGGVEVIKDKVSIVLHKETSLR